MSTPLDKMSKAERKQFFLPHLVNLVQRGFSPHFIAVPNGVSIDKYFVLGQLPYNCVAMFDVDTKRIYISYGTSREGLPHFVDGAVYKQASARRVFNRNIDPVENELMTIVNNLMKSYKIPS